ncbi:MAG: uracil-DNA glycosylase family protein [Hyphomicrobiaceae bacterium]|nr:uracil-DNA glycosylase family protein [Hyphomicrobiaceae bacterium]
MAVTSVDGDDDLDRLTAAIRACRICRDHPTGPPLAHEPRPVFQVSATARLVIAGQAPGLRAHHAGRPFADPSGVRLRAWLGIDESVFYDRHRVAIVPMGFCFPGHDRRRADLPPRAECAAIWRARLLDLLPRIELVVAIGLYAHAWHLGDRRGENLTTTVANWRAILGAPCRPRVLPLPHPSWRNNGWLGQNPWFAREVVPVLRDEVARLTA